MLNLFLRILTSTSSNRCSALSPSSIRPACERELLEVKHCTPAPHRSWNTPASCGPGPASTGTVSHKQQAVTTPSAVWRRLYNRLPFFLMTVFFPSRLTERKGEWQSKTSCIYTMTYLGPAPTRQGKRESRIHMRAHIMTRIPHPPTQASFCL